VKRPAAFINSLLARLPGRVATAFDRGEAAAYREAAREAFRTTGASIDRPAPSGPGSPAEVPRPVASAGDPLDSVVRPASYQRKRGPSRSPAFDAPPRSETVDPGAITNDSASDPLPHGQARDQAKSSAPDHLLRKPANVTRVADDFFDGVVRRVEGDR